MCLVPSGQRAGPLSTVGSGACCLSPPCPLPCPSVLRAGSAILSCALELSNCHTECWEAGALRQQRRHGINQEETNVYAIREAQPRASSRPGKVCCHTVAQASCLQQQASNPPIETWHQCSCTWGAPSKPAAAEIAAEQMTKKATVTTINRGLRPAGCTGAEHKTGCAQLSVTPVALPPAGGPPPPRVPGPWLSPAWA